MQSDSHVSGINVEGQVSDERYQKGRRESTH